MLNARFVRLPFAVGLAGLLLGAGVAACEDKKSVDASADANAHAAADAEVRADAEAHAEAGLAADAEAAANAHADGGALAAEAGAQADGGAHGDGGRKHADASNETTTAGDAADGGSKVATKTLDETAEGKTIDVAAGQTLVLLLGANPTTGFDWSVTKAPAALGNAESGYVQGGAGQMGAPGKRRFTWTVRTALPAGEHAVELAYARSFEKGVAPFKTFRLKVRRAP